MRAIWTGAIGFGLVNIPVRLYSAVESSNIPLDMLDSKDHSNIRFKRVNEKTGREVPWGNIVKGYKLPNDDYVVLNDKDFEIAAAKKSKVISIEEFIKLEDIDSVYFETPYYLEPDKTGGRAYALLREALAKNKKAGIATFVLRNKELLAVLKARGKVIVLNRIRFPEEIRTPESLNLPAASEVKASEMKMATTLIDQLTGKFDIKKYQDTYSESLMKVIKARAKGKVVKAPTLKVVHTKSKDLMDQLKASLGTSSKKSTTRHKKAS